MKLSRRRLLHLAAVAATLPPVPRLAQAQTYPARPVRLVVGYPPGGVADILARLMSQWLQERLGQPFVIENRPGAATNIAAEAVVRAPADGYTLLLANTASAINATLYPKLTFNFIRDIAPVAGIARTPLVLAVNPAVPAKSVPELIAYAKANPGKLGYASGGSGSSAHLAAELFKMMAGVDMLHVPYRGSAPALTDLIGGQVQLMFDNITSSLDHIRSGKLRGLAVCTGTRLEALPDLPTVSESVTGFEASAWQGVAVPKSTPAEIIDKLNTGINAALADARIKGRFADLSSTILAGTPADFGKLIADETEKWAKVIKFAGIKPD